MIVKNKTMPIVLSFTKAFHRKKWIWSYSYLNIDSKFHKYFKVIAKKHIVLNMYIDR